MFTRISVAKQQRVRIYANLPMGKYPSVFSLGCPAAVAILMARI
jgi:hypothetical protein